jgi:predicted ester cyclase
LTRHDRHACCAAYRALPGLHAAEHDIVAAGKTLTVRYLVEATHQGNLLGLTRTGRRVHWDAVDACHLADRMIGEEWPPRQHGGGPASGRRVHAAVAGD